MKTVRKEVARFWLQPTPSFPEGAPQRESYMTDEACDRADVRYADEWRAMYRCAGCDDVGCPQCGSQGSRSATTPTMPTHAKREDFEKLLDRSSIGMALADIKARGIDAHLVDLERAMHPRRATKKKPPKLKKKKS